MVWCYLKASWSDLSSDGHGAMFRSAHVDLVQLDHNLTDDVIARIAVEAQHHEVEGQ